MAKARKTTVGKIDPEILAYTAGKDVTLDLQLVEADCLGTMAHVSMLAKAKVKPALFTARDLAAIKKELREMVELADAGKFKITLADQDVHLAVEHRLTRRLGDVGKKVHTARSRNDQVAVDLRLFGRRQLFEAAQELSALCSALVAFGKKHRLVPMAGRTHMQPAMPSSVGLWATAHAESLLDDAVMVINAFELNDQSPLGGAAGFGVPFPIDRELTGRLLGFGRLSHNTMYATGIARGKLESVILDAMNQVMLSLSRIAQDLMIFTLPEFGYFRLPTEFGTGSSIMPNKNNPDVLELVRGRSSTVMGAAHQVHHLMKAAAAGYNRDIQEAKEPFMAGLRVTRESLRVMARCVAGLKVNRKALDAGFSPGVFATDRALELVASGMPFRDAYLQVKEELHLLEAVDPAEALAAKTHVGSPLGLDFEAYEGRCRAAREFARDEARAWASMRKKLLGS